MFLEDDVDSNGRFLERMREVPSACLDVALTKGASDLVFSLISSKWITC